MANRRPRLADSRVLLLLDGCHSYGLGRHHGGNTDNLAPYDAVDVAVDSKHDDKRKQDAAKEVEIDHVSSVDDGRKRAWRSVNELRYFP